MATLEGEKAEPDDHEWNDAWRAQVRAVQRELDLTCGGSSRVTPWPASALALCATRTACSSTKISMAIRYLADLAGGANLLHSQVGKTHSGRLLLMMAILSLPSGVNPLACTPRESNPALKRFTVSATSCVL